jgi:ribose/xylose/arabinose/galactoside ABC-type transport system permease subunit
MTDSQTQVAQEPPTPAGGKTGGAGLSGGLTSLRSRVGLLQRGMPLIALVVVVAYFSLRRSDFLTGSNIIVMMEQASILMVIAMGATLVIVAGSIDLSVGAIAALVGVLAAELAQHGHTWAVWPLVLVGALCGIVNGVLAAYVKLPSFLVTLGTMFIFDGIAAKISGGYQVSLLDQPLSDAVNATGLGSIPNGVWWAVIAMVITIGLAYRTVWGRRVYAVGGNERVAKLAGQPVERTKVWIFGYSGLLAGVAGLMLTASNGGSSPQMGDPFLLNSIAAIVMGGTSLTGGLGGPARTVLGVATIEVLTNGLVLTGVDPFVQNIALGAVIIGAVIVTMRRSEMTVVK